MTDEEFEVLDAEAARILHSGRRIPSRLARRLASCRDCEAYPTQHYMMSPEMWLSVVPGGRGRLCLACLARRLGRPLGAADFTEQPDPDES